MRTPKELCSVFTSSRLREKQLISLTNWLKMGVFRTVVSRTGHRIVSSVN